MRLDNKFRNKEVKMFVNILAQRDWIESVLSENSNSCLKPVWQNGNNKNITKKFGKPFLGTRNTANFILHGSSIKWNITFMYIFLKMFENKIN